MGRSFAHVYLFNMISVMRSDELNQDSTMESITSSYKFYKWLLYNDQKKSLEIKEQLLLKAKSRDNQSFRTSTLNIAGSENLSEEQFMILKEMGTEQMKHYYKCALSFTVYMNRDPRIEELFHMLVTLNTKKVSISFLIGSSHIPSKCGTKKIGTDSQYSTEVPKPFGVILTLHCFSYLVDYWFAKEKGKKVFKNSPLK